MVIYQKPKTQKNQIIQHENDKYEFIDTIGLDDTDDPTIVIPKLQQLINDINWQYNYIIYVLKYDTITEDSIEKIINFLQNTFGINSLEKNDVNNNILSCSKKI